MKKLMFAIAAVASGVALADVTSANIVGYLGQGVAPDSVKAMAPTFINVGGEATTIKDLKVTGDGDFDDVTFYVVMWGSDGNTLKNGDDEWLAANYPEFAEEKATRDVRLFWEPGAKKWFHCDDGDWELDMSDYPIPEGAGFSVVISSDFDDDVTVTSSGQVNEDPTTTYTDPDSVTMAGNVSPTNIKVSDLIVEGDGDFDDVTFYIVMWGSDGNTLKNGDDEWLAANYPEFAEEKATRDVRLFWEPGAKKWFHCDDGDWELDMSNYPIAAGQAFSIVVSTDFDDPVEVTVPPAIQKPVK